MISREDPRAAYRQVADAIRGDIETGKVAPGDPIPSVADIQRIHDVSNSTAQRAVGHLRSLGLIETRRGLGTFVREQRPWVAISTRWWEQPDDGEPDQWTRITRERGFAGTQDIIRVEVVEPPENILDALDVEDATAVVRERVLYRDGEPMQIVSSWFPHWVADGTPLTENRKIKGGSPKILAGLAEPPATVEKETVARMPSQRERELLDIPAGVPVLDLLMTVTSASGRVVEVQTLVARGDLHRMRDRHPA